MLLLVIPLAIALYCVKYTLSPEVEKTETGHILFFWWGGKRRHIILPL